jgi:aryl-alcohol dehydrogenase-like predicted oxidoreductase
MRYRPFGNSGKAVSALSLSLRETSSIPTPQAWRNLLFTAFENGVNCFEGVHGGAVPAEGLAAAIPAVERGLLFLSWRIEGDPRRPLGSELLGQIVRDALQQTGAGYFDLLTLDEAALAALTDDGRMFLGDIHSAGLALQIGLRGDGDGVDEVIVDPAFEVLSTPFSLVSDWRVRRRVREATGANMVAIAYDPMPNEMLKPAAAPSKGSLLHRRWVSPLSGAGTYAFLHATPGWGADELCLAYALTEPAFATVQIDAAAGLDIERLAGVADRDLPTGVPAQIEMARFAAGRDEDQRRA